MREAFTSGNLWGMKEPESETPLRRAIRESNEQEAAKRAVIEAEEANMRARETPPPENKRLQLVLQLEYTPNGRLVLVDGYVQGQAVVEARWPTGTTLSVGELAEQTLTCGGLEALLGR